MAFVLLFNSLTSIAVASAATAKPFMRQEQKASQLHRVAIDPHSRLDFTETKHGEAAGPGSSWNPRKRSAMTADPSYKESSEACTGNGAKLSPGTSDGVTFRCTSGSCIRNEGRCNLFANCDDASDEMKCRLLVKWERKVVRYNRKAQRKEKYGYENARRKLPPGQCSPSFFKKGSDCVDGDAAQCKKWGDNVPKVVRAPYVAILQIRAMGTKSFSEVATELGESDMAEGMWDPSSADEAVYKAYEADTERNAGSLMWDPSSEDEENVTGSEIQAHEVKGQMFKKAVQPTCIDPSTSDPSQWVGTCCACIQKVLDKCQGEADAECFRKQLCESTSVCQTWKDKDSSKCEKSSLLFERGAVATGRDAGANLDNAVQGKGGDTCD